MKMKRCSLAQMDYWFDMDKVQKVWCGLCLTELYLTHKGTFVLRKSGLYTCLTKKEALMWMIDNDVEPDDKVLSDVLNGLEV